MALYDVFSISGSALSAQSVRLNTVSSNLANADSASNSPEQAYRARQPVFAAILSTVDANQASVGVRVAGIVESQEEIPREYMPGNPLADRDGYVYKSNVNTVEEMANMISASRSYQNNIEVLNTSKQLLLKTLNLGR
ncbi:flagellar basal body rod protein FlgC [Thiolapillus brandeum]|uniref:Flagellar basal-body rod protein FlgC n=1 Tax=Thiolapillus brandeum TaxID=1076588 RepID=A0A7U6JHG5_9GAMM|nr:flagellar basal body rod protein FlgC [Thiolapillus brandeum]BAO44286.1 flagellar basal-body rod protein FlgC [Thiolapillus brandeum]